MPCTSSTTRTSKPIPGEDAYGKFGGKAATYYARWTYKYEEAARRGAIAALIVHETEPAAYGWNTAIAPNGEGYDIVRADPAKEKLLLQSWLHRDAAVEILRGAGLDFEALKKSARSKAFQPIELRDATFAADFPLAHARIDSHNVLGKITGRRYPNESIMVGGHWDAYGSGEPDANGLRFRAGALDDAIGMAGAIEIARAFKQGPRPDRTIVFSAWTAEERGLLGSEYYADHPWLPLETTVANFTMDVLQPNGLARDIVLVGAGQNELDSLLAQKAAGQGRVVTPDAKPERGLAFRADHFPFAKRGVPTLLLMGIGGGHDLVNGGREAGDRWVAEFTAKCYHQACDRWSATWDLRGAAQDVTLVYQMAEPAREFARVAAVEPGQRVQGGAGFDRRATQVARLPARETARRLRRDRHLQLHSRHGLVGARHRRYPSRPWRCQSHTAPGQYSTRTAPTRVGRQPVPGGGNLLVVVVGFPQCRLALQPLLLPCSLAPTLLHVAASLLVSTDAVAAGANKRPEFDRIRVPFMVVMAAFSIVVAFDGWIVGVESFWTDYRPIQLWTVGLYVAGATLAGAHSVRNASSPDSCSSPTWPPVSSSATCPGHSVPEAVLANRWRALCPTQSLRVRDVRPLPANRRASGTRRSQ